MTREQAQAILDGRDGCPFCESGNVSGEPSDYNGAFVSKEYHCLDCYKKWSCNYTMTDVQDDESTFTLKVDWAKAKLVKTSEVPVTLASAINKLSKGVTECQLKSILQQIKDKYGDEVVDKIESFLNLGSDDRYYVQRGVWNWVKSVS